ncbi:DUF1573 domain-containing protein [Chitinophaga solisilvae]|uniref:DUF1573 domain-containing protein n=1 Tax=Chitinophaga solisilvae TaxID=1233460 RepID=UPI0013689B30|nr:DUF1573 domain-containing protein [Chitinophaga solisilvae]
MILLSASAEISASALLEAKLEEDHRFADSFFSKNILVRIDQNTRGNEWLSHLLNTSKTPLLLFFNDSMQLRGISDNVASDADILTRVSEVESGGCFVHATGAFLQENFTAQEQLSHLQHLFDIVRIRNTHSHSAPAAVTDSSLYNMLKESIAEHSYFYNNYLAAKISAACGDTIAMHHYTNTALAFNDAHTVDLFGLLRTELKSLTTAGSDAHSSRIGISNTIIDLGEVKNGSNTDTVILLTNLGKKDLILSSVITGCNCTAAGFSKAPIRAGHVTAVKLSYHATAPGRFSKAVIIYSNAVNGRLEIIIKGIAV